jgi:tetratricopeptide (TPR) repeat protein/predicted Ser/Thr protein kinase
MQSGTGEPTAQADIGGTAFDGGEGSAEELLPDRVGRFEIVGELGRGAMGVVYEGRDADLDRKVAVKLLRGRSEGQDVQRARLIREAQALARLSHPNVVQVYEVGVFGDRIFIAMELVTGRTLRSWLARERPDWRAIVAVLVKAGRGLHAAHRVGLVHRDFKPENVHVDEDGRVRVLDFGLARTTGDGAVEPGVSVETDAEGSLGRATLTRSGVMMGTPAYMSPEQFAGKPADPRSDQFGFCIVAWEALWGERPFGTGSPATLARAVRAGRLRPPPSDPAVPARLRRVLERGLSGVPARRFASMEDLLAALEGAGSAPLGRFVVGPALAAAVAGAFVLAGPRGGSEADPCAGVDADLDAVWNAEARARLDGAFRATGVHFAGPTVERVTAALDAYAEAWRAARVDACVAARVHREQSDEVAALRIGCLEGRRVGLQSMVDALAAADAATVEQAVRAVETLRPIEPCADAARLLSSGTAPDDPALAAEVERLEHRLERARAVGHAGRYAEALAGVEEVGRDAQAIEWLPLHARIAQQAGGWHVQLGNLEAGREHHARAYALALEADDLDTAAEAATATTHLLGYALQRYDEALAWSKSARALARRIGPGSLAETMALDATGSVLFRRGEYEAALPLFSEALDIASELDGDHRETIAGSLNNLAAVHHYLGRRDLAREQMQRSVEIATERLGPNHPDLGLKVQNLATFALYVHDLPAARRDFRRAHDLAVSGRGPDNPDGAVALAALAALDVDEGRLDAAAPALERALASLRAGRGERHVDVAAPMTSLGRIDAARGHLAQGRARIQEALAIAEAGVGPEHPLVAAPLEGLADLLLVEPHADPARALALAERAVQIRERRSPASPFLARARLLLARAALATGDPSRARHEVDAALAYLRTNDRMASERERAEAFRDVLGDR